MTPPYVLCLMVACAVAKVRFRYALKDTAIMLAPMLLVLAAIIVFPEIPLFLPRLFAPEFRPLPGIHALTAIAPDAQIGVDVSIGPFVAIATADHRDVKVTAGHCDIRVADHVVWIRRVTAMVGEGVGIGLRCRNCRACLPPSGPSISSDIGLAPPGPELEGTRPTSCPRSI